MYSDFFKITSIDLPIFNIINYRYDSSTGTFTVPSDGDGYYYFSTYLLVDAGKFCIFDIQINGDTLCTVRGDKNEAPSDSGLGSCSATTYAVQGINIVDECKI